MIYAEVVQVPEKNGDTRTFVRTGSGDEYTISKHSFREPEIDIWLGPYLPIMKSGIIKRLPKLGEKVILIPGDNGHARRWCLKSIFDAVKLKYNTDIVGVNIGTALMIS